MLILQGTFDEAERRGYEICSTEKRYGTSAGAGIAIRGHAYPIEMSEMTDRVPLTEVERERWRRENRWRLRMNDGRGEPEYKHLANGRLKLTAPHWGGGRSNWTEGPRGALETKLASLLEELERRADEDDERARERERQAEAHRLAAEERRERERLEQIHEARVTRLTAEISDWRRAHDIREYVAALRKRLPELEPDDRERVAQWCTWAEQLSQRSDPTLDPSRIVGFDDEHDGEEIPPWMRSR